MSARQRQSDELTLAMVRLRCDGVPVAEIARRFGRSDQYVSTATNRVRDDDIKTEPEAAAEYWRPARR